MFLGRSLTAFVLSFIFTGAAFAGPITINGAGASFPDPLYAKWFSEYGKKNPGVQINYQSVGSGAGIKQFLEKTIDFGATDAPMTDEQLTKAGAKLFHLPMVIGAVVLTYSLPGNPNLNLSSSVIADIFLGKIQKWNDAALVKLNPKEKLPDLPILVVHRTDGSGTTGIFTDYLSKTNPVWKEKVGAGPSVSWPAGLGGKGNEGVAGLIKQSPGSIGYVEWIYAESNQLPVAAIQNKAQDFVKPSLASLSGAADKNLKAIPEDYRTSLVNADGKGSYPIAGFTYLLVWQKGKDSAKAGHFKKFLEWALSEGQTMAAPLHYAPLPAKLAEKVKKTIVSLE